MISIASFNCKNLKSSIEEIRSLCNVNDIVLLQETWLTTTDLPILNQIHKDFHAKGISAMDLSAGLLTGRPHGGLAILCRKSLTDTFKIVDFDDNRIMGLELQIDHHKTIIINVYLPYCDVENTDEFLSYLAKLDTLVDTASTPYIYIMGDFNADIVKRRNSGLPHRFGELLSQFCIEQNLIVSDVTMLPGCDSYTYISEAHQSTSWLDHLICTESAHALVDSVHIDYGMVSSDHLPLCTKVNLPTGCTFSGLSVNEVTVRTPRVQWDKITQEEKKKYHDDTAELLSLIQFPHELAWCNNSQCQDQCHISAIDHLYSDIVSSLQSASKSFVSSGSNKAVVPGWNDWCKEIHAEARDAFLTWKANGSPRHGPLYDSIQIVVLYILLDNIVHCHVMV